jgi:uncharacterized repeat protein (TIGR03803 family)
MYKNRLGRCVALLVALGTPMLFAVAARAADEAPGGARPEAQVVDIADFRHKVGRSPSGGVILASDGNYYGVASEGGSRGNGTIYRVDATGAVKTLHDFKAANDGWHPYGALVQGADGALYGVSFGSFNPRFGNRWGVIFRVSLDGRFDVVHKLAADESEGSYPNSPLILGRDGSLYGTTRFGGAQNLGVLFRVSPGDRYSLVAQFEPTQAAMPWGPPLEADDGDFYVPAQWGGIHHLGGLLLVSPRKGTVTTLHDFMADELLDGYPHGALAYDAAHEYLWGAGLQCVYRYRIRTSEVTNVACFDSGNQPPGPVTLGPDGTHFYVLHNRGDGAKALSIAPDGTVKLIARLALTADDEQMILDASGALVGTTKDGGARRAGSVFRIVGY